MEKGHFMFSEIRKIVLGDDGGAWWWRLSVFNSFKQLQWYVDNLPLVNLPLLHGRV